METGGSPFAVACFPLLRTPGRLACGKTVTIRTGQCWRGAGVQEGERRCAQFAVPTILRRRMTSEAEPRECFGRLVLSRRPKHGCAAPSPVSASLPPRRRRPPRLPQMRRALPRDPAGRGRQPARDPGLWPRLLRRLLGRVLCAHALAQLRVLWASHRAAHGE